MSFDVLDPVTRQHVYSAGPAEWRAHLEVARENGWSPAGTVPPPVDLCEKLNPIDPQGLVESWRAGPSYMRGLMTKDDALAFADALERALPRIPPLADFPLNMLNGDMVAHTIELCRTHRGLFLIVLPDPPGTMCILDPETCEAVHGDFTPARANCPGHRDNWRALLEVAREHGWKPKRTLPPPLGWEGSTKEARALTWKGLQKRPFGRPTWRGDYFYGVIEEKDALALAEALERALPELRTADALYDRTADTPYNQLVRDEVQRLIDICRRQRGLFLLGA